MGGGGSVVNLFVSFSNRLLEDGPCFIIQYLVSFLILQSSRREKRDLLLYYMRICIRMCFYVF